MSEVTLRTRKFIRNPLLARRQMVVYVCILQSAQTTWSTISSMNMGPPLHSILTYHQRRPPPKQTQCSQRRTTGQAKRALQVRKGPSQLLRLQNAVRRREEHGVRPHLRFPGADETL